MYVSRRYEIKNETAKWQSQALSDRSLDIIIVSTGGKVETQNKKES